MLHNSKIQYYKSLDFKDLTDNRKFWKMIKPVFSGTVKTCSSINLYENGNLISKESQVAEVLNEHFVNITDSLGIVENKILLPQPLGLRIQLRLLLRNLSLTLAFLRSEDTYSKLRKV